MNVVLPRSKPIAIHTGSSRRWRSASSQSNDAGLPRRRFHDLRHSPASLLIAAGVELVEVSMLLGHFELRVTADLYSHLQQQTASTAARHMDAVLRG